MKKEIKILAIICFSLIMAALATALISDAIVVGKSILGFVLAMIVAVVVFIVGFFLMIVSCIFIFGIYLLEQDGLWPVTWAQGAFNDVMKDYQITPTQLDALFAIRIALLVVCIAVFIMSIIVVRHVKQIKKQDKTIKRKPTEGFGKASLVLSILGVIAAIGVMGVLTILR